MGNVDFRFVIRADMLTFGSGIGEKEGTVVALYNFEGLLTDTIVVQIHEICEVLKAANGTSNKGFGFGRFHVKQGLSLVK